MSNINRTQFTQNSKPRQYSTANGQRSLRAGRQDNTTPPRERAATRQPVTVEKDARTRQMETPFPRTQKRYSSKRKTMPVMLWVKPVVKSELQRIAEQEGLSISSVGAAFLENALQQNL